MSGIEWSNVVRSTGREVYYAKRQGSWSTWEGKIEKRYSEHSPTYVWLAFANAESQEFPHYRFSDAQAWVELMMERSK